VEELSTFPGIGRLLKILAAGSYSGRGYGQQGEGGSETSGPSRPVGICFGRGGERSAGAKSDKALALMKQYAVPKERVYLVGDTVSDIEEARKAGVNSIGVTWGFQNEERLLSRRPDFLFHSPEEIEDFFMKSH
jgi:phosphoglycolate phosphatase-like HAD superfamily hydrolase